MLGFLGFSKVCLDSPLINQKALVMVSLETSGLTSLAD